MSVNLLTSNDILEDIFLKAEIRNTLNTTVINESLNSSGTSQRPGGTLLNISYPRKDSGSGSNSLLLNYIGQSGTLTQEVKANVYFYRYIGYNDREDYLNRLNRFNERLSELGTREMRFSRMIPQPYNQSLTDKLTEILNNVSSIDVRTERLHEALDYKGIFKMTGNPAADSAIRSAFITVMRLYFANEPVTNISIERNFIIKLILWADEYIRKLLKGEAEGVVPKAVYFGGIKKHEVYFLIMLSQSGCDVLYVNSEGDQEYQKIDKESRYSIAKEYGLRGPVAFEFDKIKSARKPEADFKNISLADVTKPEVSKKKEDAVIILKKAIDIFEDILFPMNKRTGYIGLPSPNLPVYFYRYIGIEGETLISEDEYYNRVYALDKKFEKLNTGYVKFVDHIPAPANDEVDETMKRFKSFFNSSKNFDRNFIISQIVNAGILKGSRDTLTVKLVNNAFENVTKLYLSREANVNPARFENFIYKFIIWINRYHGLLFRKNDFTDSPKVLHYGDIKAHEIFFLIFLSNIGCDIIYLNTEAEKDKPFKEIDPDEEYTTLILNDRNPPLRSFPDREIVIRKSTTAFNASQEIESIIYSEDVGIFKPWQFEDYMTRPVTLKVTLDELKILWREDAKLRPEFKVENGNVYVPNLFAKINGTNENLEQYWDDYKYFAKTQNTVEKKTVPFTTVGFTKQEKYAAAFILDNNGLVSKEAFQNSRIYKFGYLRTSLQSFLIGKLNELLKSNNFRRAADNDFKLHILMTIATIEEDILKLLEVFDYPGSIPKLVIYNNGREPFSDEDSIIITFLNLIGFDIVVFTPTNYNTIEQKIKEDLFDKFQLPSIRYDLEIPAGINYLSSNEKDKPKSLFSRILGI